MRICRTLRVNRPSASLRPGMLPKKVHGDDRMRHFSAKPNERLIPTVKFGGTDVT